MVAIAMVPLIGILALAIDYGNMVVAQTALQNYLDLEDLRSKLVAWHDGLAAYDDIIRLRRENYEPLLPDVDGPDLGGEPDRIFAYHRGLGGDRFEGGLVLVNDGGISTMPELMDPRDLYSAVLGGG